MRVVVDKLYRAGPQQVVITWRDGSITTYPARALFVLERHPLRIRGRLFRVERGTALGYEAPALVPA
jgi:hypothetical protein